MKRKQTGKRSCEVCKVSENQFIYDAQTADWICTLCGCVVRKWFFDENFNANYEEYKDAVHEKDYFKRQANKKQNTTMSRMMDRANPEDVKDRKFHAMLSDIGDQLNFNERDRGRTETLFIKFPELKSQRKQYNVIAAVLVVAKKSYGEYVNINKIQSALNCKLNQTMKEVMEIIGVSQSSLTLKAIPYYISTLALPFKEEKRLRNLFNKATRVNSAMGSDTLMALCIHKLLIHLQIKSFDLKFIANITNTSQNSLQSYVSGKNSCTLFCHA